MASGVEFDEDNLSASYRRPVPGGSGIPSAGGGYQQSEKGGGMAGWLVRHGYAKSNGSAQVLLLVVVVLNIIVTFILIKFFL